jgi:hypothetical protein
MILKRDFELYLFFSFIVSSLIFCIGFFPFTKPNSEETGFENIDKLNIQNSIDKSILMIIDALRLDLVENSQNFPYLHKLVIFNNYVKHSIHLFIF